MKKMLLAIPMVFAVVASVNAERRMLFAAQPENSTFVKVTNNTNSDYLLQACEGGYKKNCDMQRSVAAGKSAVLTVPDRMSKGEVKNIESYNVSVFNTRGELLTVLKNVKVGVGFSLNDGQLANTTETTFIMKNNQPKAQSWVNPQ
jgi:hypothetical protein